MVEFVPGTEDSGEAVFGYFLGEMSPDGMTDFQDDRCPGSVPHRLRDSCQGLAGSVSGTGILFPC